MDRFDVFGILFWNTIYQPLSADKKKTLAFNAGKLSYPVIYNITPGEYLRRRVTLESPIHPNVNFHVVYKNFKISSFTAIYPDDDWTCTFISRIYRKST